MSTEKKVIPVLCISLIADDKKQYWLQIRELKDAMGIINLNGSYNMGVSMSVVIDGDSITLVAHREDGDHVIEVEYSQYDDSGDEDYFFIGSNDDPDDTLFVVATVRQYQHE